MTELLSLVVSVRPVEDVAISANLSGAVYVLLLRWLRDYDAELAAHWHDTDGHKPFACSSLVGAKRISKDTRLLPAGDTCWFRVTALNTEIAAALRRVMERSPQTVEVDDQLLPVEEMTTDPQRHPWAGETTYETLSAPYLLARETPPRRVHLQFVTPTFFRQHGMTTPLPLPELVFGSLCDRWNAFSAVAVSDGVRQYAAQCMALSRYELRSRILMGKNDIPHMGAVGQARYVGVRFDRYWMSVAALLADYAFYAGVGRSTSIGAGQVRRVLSD
jgi:CRISPR-associated endoribonuclease Cas6